MDVAWLVKQMNAAGAKREAFVFACNFELTDALFALNPLEQNDIWFKINGQSNYTSNKNVSKSSIKLDIYPESYEQYKKRFDLVHQGILKGKSFLTNLTCSTLIDTNVALETIFASSNAPYSMWIPNKFVCFSPERFVRIANAKITSCPMKGTIEAHLPDAEQTILNDFKETAEHYTIVDLIRNDLSRVANKVNVNKFRYINELITSKSNLLQVSSEIEASLSDDYLDHLGDILLDLLPAGSISGAPKEASLKLINAAEGRLRGYYTGIMGYFDGTCLDTGVMIRYIEQKNNQFYFSSGGGITAYSNSKQEYDEMIDKIYLPFD